MSRNKDYQRFLNSKRWKLLRQEYLREHPLCERCKREGEAAGVPGGYITSAVDLHHKMPVESAKSLAEMESLCFDWKNLEALCIPCHQKTHAELRSHSKEAHKKREDDRLQQWIARHSRR